MIDNPVLAAVRARRSTRTFGTEPVTDEQLEAILEAGRWAPSSHNTQPWHFVVVSSQEARTQVAHILRRVTFAWGGFRSAPVMIVVSVDPAVDPKHFVEDGAAAVQNLCLAAQSLGLASSWAGIHSQRATDRGAGRALKRLLGVPRSHRIIAVVPIGVAGNAGKSSRRPLDHMVHYERFGPLPDVGANPTRRSLGEPATTSGIA